MKIDDFKYRNQFLKDGITSTTSSTDANGRKDDGRRDKHASFATKLQNKQANQPTNPPVMKRLSTGIITHARFVPLIQVILCRSSSYLTLEDKNNIKMVCSNEKGKRDNICALGAYVLRVVPDLRRGPW